MFGSHIDNARYYEKYIDRLTEELRNAQEEDQDEEQKLPCVYFAGKRHDKCPTCFLKPRQAPLSKGGWGCKMIAVIVAHECGNHDLVNALLTKLLTLVYFL